MNNNFFKQLLTVGLNKHYSYRSRAIHVDECTYKLSLLHQYYMIQILLQIALVLSQVRHFFCEPGNTVVYAARIYVQRVDLSGPP